MIQTFGDYALDDALYQLRRRDRVIPIEPKVFDVLLHLLRNRERVVSKAELLDTLWPGEVVSDSVLPRCIAAARRALRDTRSRQKVIQTVHGRGYRFVATVESAAQATPASEPAATARPDPASEAPASGFVGRDATLSRLRTALADARAGRSRLVLLVGEPGIGKSRTADVVGAEATASGARWLAGRCYEGDGAPAFWPWRQVLRALLTPEQLETLAPGFGQLALRNAPGFDGEQLRFRLFDGIASALLEAASKTPLLITLDDLHWADPDSLRLLRFLAGEVRNAPLLILASYRDVEVRRDHPPRALLGDLAREPHCQHLALRGLERDEVAALIESMAGSPAPAALVDAVSAMTEGNPFFVRELVALLGEEGRLDDESAARSLSLPQGVRDAVGRRLDSLSDECNEVLRVCAVIGRDFETHLLERLVDARGEALLELLGEAEAAGILSEISDGPGRYAFTHALMRQTLYEELRAPRRIALHRRVGEALATLHESRPDRAGRPAAELAHHFYEAMPAGTATEAIAWCVRAAEASLAEHAYDECARQYERAVEALDFSEPDAGRRCELTIALGDALRTSGQREAGRKQLAQAAELARAVGRADLLARAAIGYRGFGEMGVPPEPETVALLEEARDAVGNSHPRLRAQLLARLTGTPPHSNRMETRARLSEEAWALARESGDPAALTDALSARYWATLGPDRVDERLATAREAKALSERLDDRRLMLLAFEIDVGAHLALGNRQELEFALSSYADLADQLRQPFFRFLAAVMQASRAMNEGRFEDAEDGMRNALELGRGTVAYAELLFFGQVFWLLQRKGDFERVAQSVLEMAGRFQGQFFGAEAVVDIMYAIGHAGVGDHAAARQAFDAIASRGFDSLERDEHWLLLMGLLTNLAIELQDVARGEALYQLLLPYAGLFVAHDLLRAVAGSVPSTLGRLALLTGRTAEAVLHFERALEMEEAAGAAPALVESQVGLADALEARAQPGDDARAEALRGAAAAGSERLGIHAKRA